MALDDLHKVHFTDRRPTIEEWKQRRQLYVEMHHQNYYEEPYQMDQEHWFNDLRISVYLRDPHNLEDNMSNLKSTIKQKIPGYDFDQLHLHTNHDDQLCLDGDIFSHSKAWRYSESEKVERKNKHTEKDLEEGKIREGDYENIDLEDDEYFDD